jgi:hypothetical protein
MGVADEFGYAHHSGRYDRRPPSLATAALNLAKEPKVYVIAFTEVSTPARHKALASALDKIGWGLVYQPKQNKDTAIGFDRAVFKQVYAVTKLLSDVPTPGHGNLRTSWSALSLLLEYRFSGHTYIFSAAHTPSHVATNAGWRPLSRAKAHREGMKNWNNELRRLTLLWKPTGGRAASMDLNMDVAQRWVRAYLLQMMPTMNLVKDSHYEDTHDRRTIDVILIGRRLNPIKWFKGHYLKVIKTSDSDHKAVIAQLRRVR